MNLVGPSRMKIMEIRWGIKEVTTCYQPRTSLIKGNVVNLLEDSQNINKLKNHKSNMVQFTIKPRPP